MYLTEFQVESSNAVNGRWRDRAEIFGPSRARAAIESLLLSCRFRGYLSNSERELLDNLAIDNTIAFLIQGASYLHPCEFAPVPIGQVQASVHACGDAMFVQHYQPHTDRHSGTRKLYTARIGASERGDLVLGMIGPVANGDRELQFEQLVGEFRKAWRASEAAAQIVAETLTTQPTAMVVNRASGRVILATDRLAEILGVRADQLVDSEYSHARAALRERLIGHRLSLRNIDVNDMYLCLVTLVPLARETAQADALQRVSRFLIHTMRNKLAAISVASGHLQDQRQNLTEEECAELSSIIGGQVDQLDRHLERLGLLMNYPCYQTEHRPVATEISQAVKALHQEYSDVTASAEIGSQDMSVALPRPALGLVIDAVLRSHTLRCRERCHHDITMAGSPAGVSFDITTTPAGDAPELVAETHWWSYAQQLTSCMSGVLDAPASPSAHTVKATLFLPIEPAERHKRDIEG